MSGRHAVERRPVLPWLLAPVRPVWSVWARLAGAGEWVVFRAVGVVARVVRRSDEAGDDEAAVASSATSPDPVPCTRSAVSDEPARPVPLPVMLPPEQALQSLHATHPDLPCDRLGWRIHGSVVAGHVHALDGTPAEHRSIVARYATVLACPVVEHADGAHVTVATAGEYAGVTVLVSATLLLRADTMPLPVYRESAGTLSTQAIPDEVLREVMAA